MCYALKKLVHVPFANCRPFRSRRTAHAFRPTLYLFIKRTNTALSEETTMSNKTDLSNFGKCFLAKFQTMYLNIQFAVRSWRHLPAACLPNGHTHKKVYKQLIVNFPGTFGKVWRNFSRFIATKRWTYSKKLKTNAQPWTLKQKSTEIHKFYWSSILFQNKFDFFGIICNIFLHYLLLTLQKI